MQNNRRIVYSKDIFTPATAGVSHLRHPAVEENATSKRINRSVNTLRLVKKTFE